MNAQPAGRGFTLLELLIVLGILSVLLGLLYPTISKAQEIIRRNRTRDRIREISLALEAFKKDFGQYPPSKDAPLSTRSGAGNLMYYLLGPAGTGWGVEAGGGMPFPGQRPQRSYPPYLTPDESLLVYRNQQIAGIVDAFDPAGDILGKLRGRILYFRARPGQTKLFDATENELDASRVIEGFKDQTHFELSVSAAPAAAGQPRTFIQKDYILVSPGFDRRYGFVKTADTGGGEMDLVPAVEADKDKSCDDITSY
jgi:prepilin-type N-terminal cleavage/methylation domain-containing protein